MCVNLFVEGRGFVFLVCVFSLVTCFIIVCECGLLFCLVFVEDFFEDVVVSFIFGMRENLVVIIWFFVLLFFVVDLMVGFFFVVIIFFVFSCWICVSLSCVVIG